MIVRVSRRLIVTADRAGATAWTRTGFVADTTRPRAVVTRGAACVDAPVGLPDLSCLPVPGAPPDDVRGVLVGGGGALVGGGGAPTPAPMLVGTAEAVVWVGAGDTLVLVGASGTLVLVGGGGADVLVGGGTGVRVAVAVGGTSVLVAVDVGGTGVLVVVGVDAGLTVNDAVTLEPA